MPTEHAQEQLNSLLRHAVHSNLDIGVTELLNIGADINHLFLCGDTMLIKAINLGLTDMVKQLIQSGANIDGKCSLGRTALMHAIKLGHADIVSILVGCGATKSIIDASGVSAFTLLIRNSNKKVERAFHDTKLIPIIYTCEKCRDTHITDDSVDNIDMYKFNHIELLEYKRRTYVCIECQQGMDI